MSRRIQVINGKVVIATPVERNPITDLLASKSGRDILMEIMSHLNAKSLITFASTCKGMKQIVYDALRTITKVTHTLNVKEGAYYEHLLIGKGDNSQGIPHGLCVEFNPNIIFSLLSLNGNEHKALLEAVIISHLKCSFITTGQRVRYTTKYGKKVGEWCAFFDDGRVKHHKIYNNHGYLIYEDVYDESLKAKAIIRTVQGTTLYVE